MAFSIWLRLPQENTNIDLNPEIMIEEDDFEFIDDINDLGSLIKSCRALGRHGVCVGIRGFFVDDLPLHTGSDLPFVLENMSEFVRFLQDEFITEFSLGLVEQGTEVVLSFTKSDELIEVTASSGIEREVRSTKESVTRTDLVEQLQELLELYLAGVDRYAPHLVSAPCNLRLLDEMLSLRSGA